jgi:hypothetical protein
LAISTSSPDALAASTKRAAGRAWRPTEEAMVTVRVAMDVLLLWIQSGRAVDVDQTAIELTP